MPHLCFPAFTRWLNHLLAPVDGYGHTLPSQGRNGKVLLMTCINSCRDSFRKIGKRGGQKWNVDNFFLGGGGGGGAQCTMIEARHTSKLLSIVSIHVILQL